MAVRSSSRPSLSPALLAGGVVLVAINLRPAAASIGPVLDRIQADTGLSSGWAGALATLPVLCFGLMAPLAPPLARRLGVHTAIAVAYRNDTVSGVETTRVWFRPLDERIIREYVKTGEPLDKAGAYAVQGIGAMFIDSIHGSYTNVVGLPLATLFQMLRRAGIDPLTNNRPEPTK